MQREIRGSSKSRNGYGPASPPGKGSQNNFGILIMLMLRKEKKMTNNFFTGEFVDCLAGVAANRGY